MEFTKNRLQMVKSQLQSRGISNHHVLNAMKRVPREHFVPPELSKYAYNDTALPLSHGQSISQPFTVARLVELLVEKVKPPHAHILDVGTGSGYQAAVLAEIYDHITTIEITPNLADKANKILNLLGYTKIQVVTGDANRKLFPKNSFDGIIVAAAANNAPQALIIELKVDGAIIIPIKDIKSSILTRITKTPSKLTIETFERYAFVPLRSIN